MPPQNLSVAILDDELTLLDTLAFTLESHGVEVRQRSTAASEFLEAVQRMPPAIAIVGLRVDSMTGALDPATLQLLDSLRRSVPETRTVVLSAHHDPNVVDRCFGLGAGACLFKRNASSQDVLQTLQAVHRGERVFPVTRLPTSPAATARVPSVLDTLTPRELEVLRYVSAGWDNLKISVTCGITERTVKAHLAALYRKLEVENRTQLALRGRELGVRPAG